ncbi:hypothetical protein M2480_001719 [Parabacteroides sp. PFB2-12]|uniref:RagB/SusD family nutrient uptake outer membrane protein n=1 Tax=unclassified Parabacteroides TaxID=2649774 RepID=UPI00247343BF|nr:MULTISPECIES: RagB/SusD family nutrient uptake outer membrane protein [unclassified Parabacteroides]MDH6343092.1 hypothetical protein [Parabacteroides sp. PM6-13]MDH6390737.1 hypothetical protein [Parabacteroides sp. PFB2-12]
MKNHIKHIAFTGIIALFMGSCSDFLDEKGYNTDYTYYETTEGLETLVVSCYQNGRGMFSTSNTPSGIAFQEIGTDLYTIGGDGSTDFGLYTSAMNPSNETFSSFWTDCYNGVARANLGLKYLYANNTMAESLKNIREGELLFLRAYYYYVLAVHYGSCPLILEPVDEPKFDFARAPQKDIWDQIVSDATKAWELLPWADANGNVTNDYGRASKGAAGHLLTKAHLFRYCGYKYASNQSDSNMNEDRGGSDGDLDKAIQYASAVCNFGTGAGSGSNHALAENFADLWRFDPKTGGPTPGDYAGPEVLFSIQFSTDHFYNNQAPSATNSGGNWLHMMFTSQVEGMPMVTVNGKGTENVSLGTSMGIGRNLITGRPWRRTSPTPYLYAEDGLYGPQYYAGGKAGKLIDSRLYKSHVWVYYANQVPNTTWITFENAAGSFNPANIGKEEGTQRYEKGDTAVVFSVENIDKRFANGTTSEKLALSRAMSRFWYIPMPSITRTNLGNRGNRDGITNTFPTLIKYLDSRRGSADYQAGFRDYFCYRLGETYILLAEALAMKGDYDGSAAALNIIRERAAWKEGEEKYTHFYLFDGGNPADFTKSTVEDMKVNGAFISAMNDQQRLVFFADESGRETEGELHRFENLVRNGADFFVKMVKERNYYAEPNIKPFHRFRPIPQKHIDRLDPADPNPQNYGY